MSHSALVTSGQGCIDGRADVAVALSPCRLWDRGFSCCHRNLHRGSQPKGIVKMHNMRRAQGAPHGSQRGLTKPIIVRDGATASLPGLCHISQPMSWGSVALSHNILGAFATLWSKVPNRTKISLLLLFFCIRPGTIHLEALTGPSLMFKVCFCCGFPGLALAPHRFLPCSTQLLHPIQASLMQSSPLILVSVAHIDPKLTSSTLLFFNSQHSFNLAWASKDVLSCLLVLRVQLNFSVLPSTRN